MSDGTQAAITIVLTVLGTPTVMVFLAWHFKESIKAYLLVGAHKAINEHKQVLDTYTESMKHSLQREMVRVESYVKGKFTVYPVLYEKILKAQGSVSSLFGVRFSTNQDRFTEEDLRSALDENRVVDGEVQHILGVFRSDNKTGLEIFNRMMREIEFQKARNVYHEAKNYLVLNELFLSKEAADHSYKIFTSMWSVWVDSQMSHQSQGHYDKTNEVRETNAKNDAMIGELKDMMRREMEPDLPK